MHKSYRIEKGKLFVNNKPSMLFSGDVHYFRLEPRYWRPILQRLKDAGIEWVGSYVPWRRHDKGVHAYDFEGRTDDKLNLPRFLELCQEMELSVYFRPGPLIVSEMACGGYPDWLGHSGPEYMVWTAKGELTKGFLGENNPGCSPSYLHPKYLEHCRCYLTEVNKVVAPYLHQNGGPIRLYQLDNEVSFICRDAMFQSDYNPHIVGSGGEYHQWLSRKYGVVSDVPYGKGKDCIEDILPPRNLDEFGRVPMAWYFDWAEFKEYMLAEYVRRIKQIHLDCGVDDVVFCTNFNPHCPNSMPNNWNEQRKACDAVNPGLVGYDVYRNPFLTRTAYGSLSRIGRQVSSYFPLPWSAEFMAGFWFEDFSENGKYPFAEHHEFLSDTAIAHGFRGLSWYMFHDREYWGGAPVSERGHTRYAYEALRSIMKFVNGAEDFGGLVEDREVGILNYRPYLRHTFIGDDMPAREEVFLGPPDIDGVPAGRTAREFEGLFAVLTDANYHPGVIDPDINLADIKRHKVVFAVTQTFMDADTQQALLEYVRDGGILVCGPPVPVKDLGFRDLSVLGRHISAERAGSLCRGTRFFTDIGEIACEGEFYRVSGEPVIETQDGGRILVAETPLGKGYIVSFAGYFSQQRDPTELADNYRMYAHILKRYGIESYAETDVRNVEVVVLSGGGETYVYLLNHDKRSHTVVVTFRDVVKGTLVDLRGSESVSIRNRSFTADVDTKRARLFKLEPRPV